MGRETGTKTTTSSVVTTLKEAQPGIPQRVTINSHKLPHMTVGDDLESFVNQLEAALVAMITPRDEWKQYMHSQKDKVMHLLTNKDSTDEIKAGLLESTAMSFAATAEAIFGPVRSNEQKLQLR